MARSAERNAETRERILVAAERLFAERGVVSVSNRQIGEAAGQRNTAVVGYHFGTKAGLIQAIAQRHTEPLEQIRQEMVDAGSDSTDLRDWVSCLVLPLPRHLASLGSPTWYARFAAQVVTDPVLRSALGDHTRRSPSYHQMRDGLRRCLRELPEPVWSERSQLTSTLLIHACADFEGALAEGRPTIHTTWEGMAAGLVDAAVGILRAPATALTTPGTP
ncbi:TetR/AcrR family transcriptional regulator [Cryptosporangium aurantiacum]|uniref:Transcriptional regulator, TetR family n=1 Tax=Cryptosporangium aurantiacum TaxID=134849 RepID=A0A1M7RG64_9ACTN|nr:TetR family transcriptional regulator [Cryptosporangium aurantiacum]SHN45196.1 transcriptional regulator, TetR family [Cryptosporangium aurantiacum]